MRLLRALPIVLLGLLPLPRAYGQTAALLLFGAEDHKTSLGCLNCSKYDAASICNAYGVRGSKYNSESIWNPYGTFGSKYSVESPWNRYATDSPIIVDKDGQFYGRFTANKFAVDRTKIEVLNQLTELVANGTDLSEARNLFCER
jgi:hypothetical protein